MKRNIISKIYYWPSKIIKKNKTKLIFFPFLKKASFIQADLGHYDLILDFLKDQRSPETHLAFVLKNLLSHAKAKNPVYNFILLTGDKIIGFDSNMLFPNHYVWAQGLTVDFSFRRLECAKRLHSIGIKVAFKNNLNLFRIAVLLSQIPIIKKFGFNEFKLWHILVFKSDNVEISNSKFFNIREAINFDIAHIEQFLRKSDQFALSDQMYAEDLVWYPLDRLWLSTLIEQGKVLISENRTEIQGLAIINKKSIINPFLDNGKSLILEIGYFDGDCAKIFDFVIRKHRPRFVRIYSANSIPLKYLPIEIEDLYFASFTDLFGGMHKIKISSEKAFFTSLMLMQKNLND